MIVLSIFLGSTIATTDSSDIIVTADQLHPSTSNSPTLNLSDPDDPDSEFSDSENQSEREFRPLIRNQRKNGSKISRGQDSFDENYIIFLNSINEYKDANKEELKIRAQTRVREFWQLQKIKFPQIFKVAGVLYAIPPTQCSVERMFSTLKFIANNLRLTLTTENVNDIILLKMNSAL